MTLDGDVAHRGVSTGLERVRLAARALPGGDLRDVDTSAALAGRPLSAPLLVSCMTGGTSEAGEVNAALAMAAQDVGVALGLGSGRVLLQGGDPASFLVRHLAPDVPLLANLGAVQLPEIGVAGCRDLIARTDADVLVLHLNAVQEAVQPGGDTNFAGLDVHIREVATTLEIPVMVKEVGFGLATADIAALLDAGVAGIDVAGAGGTNWATVEGLRDDHAGRIAAAFAGWGWPTLDSLLAARREMDARDSDALLVASGGLTDGVDAAKCLALGADLAAFGRRLLPAAADGPQAAREELAVIIEQLRVATWAVGAAATAALCPDHLV